MTAATRVLLSRKRGIHRGRGWFQAGLLPASIIRLVRGGCRKVNDADDVTDSNSEHKHFDARTIFRNMIRKFPIDYSVLFIF